MSERSDPEARWSSEATFRDLKKGIAERNEAAYKEAREIRAARDRKKLGIVTRRAVDINR